MKQTVHLALFIALGLPLYSGTTSEKATLGSQYKSSPWSFSANLTWRRMGSLSHRAGNNSQGFAIPSLFPPSQTSDPNIGGTAGFADRAYDDGFVNQSAFTEATGTTSFWGYDNASQVTGDTIQFNATGTRTVFDPGSTSSTNFRDSENFDTIAPQFDFRLSTPSRPYGISGLLISLAYSGSDHASRFSNFSGSQNQQVFRRNITDSFELGGLAGSVPAAGFSGTFTGPAPLIPNIPSDRNITENLASTNTASITNDINAQADIDALSIAIGPIFENSINHKTRWEFAAGTTLTLYDWSSSHNESLSANVNGVNQNLANFSNSRSGTHLGIGLFARGSLIYDISDEWFATTHLQFEVGNSFDLSSGPSQYEFDPNGFSFGLGFGKNF